MKALLSLLTFNLKKYRVRIRNIFISLVAIGFLTVITLTIFAYASHVNDGFFPNKREDLGQFGDYFGGILNPIFGFSSFIALLITIVFQAKELKLSRKELELTRDELSKSASALASQNKAIELQSFEQTFFSWLSTYRELLTSISVAATLTRNEGRAALHSLWSSNLSAYAICNSMYLYNDASNVHHLKPEFNSTYANNFDSLSHYKKIEIVADVKQNIVANYIHQIWCLLYKNEEYQLDSLFRTSYKLISWIDTQPTERLTNQQKWLYISIFRSQLSQIEMVFLYYNGLTGSGKKFKELIEKYALFDNLTLDSDIGMKVMSKYFDTQNYYTPTAFNSEIARNELNVNLLAEQQLATRVMHTM